MNLNKQPYTWTVSDKIPRCLMIEVEQNQRLYMWEKSSTCEYQVVKNVIFSENFAHALNEWFQRSWNELVWWYGLRNPGAYLRPCQTSIYHGAFFENS